ncbi:RNA polymerase II-associated protein [Desulfurivibrio sp. C05AmB]|uniref:RNA polymerase II-associated protein n=1 Tax=Desulfurivibrio sp. C05AmB TaxID=3374371 RepID=UPI00376EC9B9
MDLICEKYRKRMAEADARCPQAREYCKFRSACLIHFLDRERRRKCAREAEAAGQRRENTEAGTGPAADGRQERKS